MKSKLVIGILVLAFLLCQGIAFAEVASDVTAVAEETTIVEETDDGIVEETVVEEELVAPAMEAAEETPEEVAAEAAM